MRTAVCAEFSFEYLEGAATADVRAAVYYEFARESRPLIDLVADIRAAYVLHERPASADLQTRINSICNVWPHAILMGLAECSTFPKQPFFNCWNHPESQLLVRVAVPQRITQIPWNFVFQFVRPHPVCPSKRIIMSRGAPSMVVFSIPWRYSDNEILEMLGAWLQENRPWPSHTSKKVAGRGGNRAKTGIDLLHQLAAWRTVQRGLTLSQAGKAGFIYCSTEKGRRKAVESCNSRLGTLLTVPLL